MLYAGLPQGNVPVPQGMKTVFPHPHASRTSRPSGKRPRSAGDEDIASQQRVEAALKTQGNVPVPQGMKTGSWPWQYL